jgi:lipoprotein-anchoring transpeptidase ErfK/SrfK
MEAWICRRRNQSATILFICVFLLAGMFSLSVPAGAQGARASAETMRIDDQPGYVPDPSEERIPTIYQRQVVFYRTTEAPGTIIVHTAERFLYVIQENSRAIRYGIGVGRDGFQWSRLLKITRKSEWPDWTPPPEMIARQPYLPRFMAGGPGNPLGARALYLGSTVYRIHGTNQPQTIGQSISSGCFRVDRYRGRSNLVRVVNPDIEISRRSPWLI